MKTKNFISRYTLYVAKKGFTLLEMLVVIGIIAVLLGMGAASYSTAQKKSRDAKRKADIKAIHDAFEQYYAICGYAYPTTLGASVACTSPATTLMSTVPTDPKTGAAYGITPGAGSSYTLCTGTLETESTSYCLSNQQ